MGRPSELALGLPSFRSLGRDGVGRPGHRRGPTAAPLTLGLRRPHRQRLSSCRRRRSHLNGLGPAHSHVRSRLGREETLPDHHGLRGGRPGDSPTPRHWRTRRLGAPQHATPAPGRRRSGSRVDSKGTSATNSSYRTGVTSPQATLTEGAGPARSLHDGSSGNPRWGPGPLRKPLSTRPRQVLSRTITCSAGAGLATLPDHATLGVADLAPTNRPSQILAGVAVAHASIREARRLQARSKTTLVHPGYTTVERRGVRWVAVHHSLTIQLAT